MPGRHIAMMIWSVTRNGESNRLIVQDDINNSTIETPKTLKETLESAKDSIDDYQSSIKSLSDSMADVNALSTSDIVDLMQANPNFDWDKYGVTGAAGVGELDDALQALVEQQMKEIDSALDSAGASDEMREAFASMGREAIANADRMGAVTGKLKDISSAYKTVQTALQEYAETGYMSVENATAMLNLDDAYLAALVNEQGQITLQADAYRQLMDARLDEAEAKATQQAIADLESITSESTALAYLTQNNYAVASSLYEKANAYAQVEAAAKKALAAEGAGKYTNQAVNGIMNAYKARMSVIQATRNSVARSVPKTLGGSSGSGGGKGSSSASKPSSKEMDWFDIRIKKLNEAIELTQTHLDNLTGSKSKNHLIDTLESIYSTKQNDLRQGLAMYSKMAQEELAKIPDQFREAAQNGALGITDFIGDGNDDLVEAIENYRKLAEKVGDLENQVAELDATIRKLQVDKFKNIADDYEKLIGITDDYRDKIQSVIDLEENSGNKIGVGFYDSLVSQTQERKKLLEQEFDTLNKDLQDALSSGKIKLGSDEWEEMRDIIVDVDSEIIQCSSDIEDFINAKLELKVKEFEEIHDALDGINDSLSDYISLVEKDTVTNGTTELVFTKEALTQMGLLQQQYELASEKVELYNKRMQELKKTYSDGLLSETEYREQLMELISAQNEQAVAMKDSKEAILDLIRNGIDEVCDAIDKETEAYQKLIDKKKEALEQDKDDADFRAQVAEKQKAIFAVQRQIAALGNADDLESNARRKQLQSDLLNAKTELDELYADHNYDLQMDMLDKEAETYEESQEEKKDTLQKSLDDEEAIIAKYLQEVIDNHTSVYETLQEIGMLYGIRLEESITEPWRIGQDAVGQYAVSLGSQTSLFITQLQGVENEIYGVQSQANNMAYSLINAFGVSSDRLMNQISNVDYALAVDYGYAQNLGSMLSSVLEANYNTSGIVSSIYSIRDAANEAAGAISGMLNGSVSIPTHTTSSSNKMKFTDWVSNNKNQLKLKTNPLPGATGVAGLSKHIKAYAKGGVVTKDDDNPLNPIAESLGEDTMVAVKEGEWIIDRDTAEELNPLAKALYAIDAPFLTNSVSNDSNNLRNMDLLNPLNHYMDVIPNNTRNDINIVNEVNIQGNVDNDNVRRIQKQINNTIEKYLKDMLREIRY